MKFINSNISDLLIIKPKVIKDNRGYFMESFNQKLLSKHISKIKFIQDNESKSKYGVLRGLHFQIPPYSQTKLVRVISGKVLDIAVDLRKNSNTYGMHEAIELSSENKLQLLIPPGFAHGFLVLSDYAIFSYKVDNHYSPKHDYGIKWNDPKLNIDWKINVNDIKVSEKDSILPLFNEFNSPF